MASPGRPRKYDEVADEINRAICDVDEVRVKTLVVGAGANVADGYGRTPLFAVAVHGEISLMQWLIENGGNVNHQDRDGLTPLHLAAQEKNLEIVMCLLDNGADANIFDAYGNGPLWRATFEARGDYDIVEILITGGADPNSRNNSGKSPLTFAETIGDDKLKAILGKS